jgi:hypothetical protein
MRYIFLLLSLIGSQFCSDVRAQIKIDSIVVHIDSMRAIHCTSGSPCDTSWSSVPINIYDSANSTTIKFLDSSVFSGIDSGKGSLILDTSRKLILLYSYYLNSGDPSLNFYWKHFSVENIPYHSYGRDLVTEIPPMFIPRFQYQNGNFFRMSGNRTSTSTTDGIEIRGSSRLIIYGLNQVSAVEPIIPPGKFICMPNPASSVITISGCDNTIKSVDIYDLLGRKVNDYHFAGESSFSINISSLPPGIYYLRAGNQMQKFVIQR